MVDELTQRRITNVIHESVDKAGRASWIGGIEAATDACAGALETALALSEPERSAALALLPQFFRTAVAGAAAQAWDGP